MDHVAPPAPTRFGPEVHHDGGVLFRLWAPSQSEVALVLEADAPRTMHRTDLGWHSLLVPDARPGTRYRFRLADGLEVPDPASRYQPEDVHGPSEVVDAAFAWSDRGWRGRPWEEAVVYELHVGAFTAEGTFAAAIERLDYLAELGVTAIELMPVAEFPGARNWGYDGVLLFAPDASYGRPDDMKALVDAAHARGIMVFLDVVYNHFGPDGNYLAAYAPIFNDQHQTPWGDAVNYDAAGSETVREFVIQNAIYWIDEFHLDGLRFDAVHAIKDDSDPHLLAEIPSRLRAGGLNRPIHLMLENEENEVARLARDVDGEPQQYTAQWNDDLHHVLHAAASGETSGYYAEYAGDTEKLGRALAEGFAFQGDHMRYSDRSRGQPSRHLPPTAFVGFIQNHDQIGNRAFGDRLTSFAPAAAVEAAAAVYLLLPQIPMLFMGEEFGSSRPFPFFCDFSGALADAVREGRRKEFARFPEFADPKMREAIPDPGAAATFEAAKLDWNEPRSALHAQWLELYRALLAIRHREIIPRLKHIGGNSARFKVLGRLAVEIDWTLPGGAHLNLIANLSDQPLPGVTPPGGRRLWPTTPVETASLPAWQVLWTLSDAA
ncbi:MAG TPA: malto-oligosyltrehalose trehalohydrolase [Rhodopseudomonas sp.]|uniref:malto-oligosyltrehalose trehalohydrolase n=1 Tax=Rhodopseudomonas sp. TaxID=1078 RepID=UPI002EDA8E44